MRRQMGDVEEITTGTDRQEDGERKTTWRIGLNMYVDQEVAQHFTPASCQTNRFDSRWSFAAGVVVSDFTVG